MNTLPSIVPVSLSSFGHIHPCRSHLAQAVADPTYQCFTPTASQSQTQQSRQGPSFHLLALYSPEGSNGSWGQKSPEQEEAEEHNLV